MARTFLRKGSIVLFLLFLQGHTKSVQISIVSANVNSLIPAQDDRSYSRVSCAIMSSKVQVLELEFNSYEAEIICVQEGRARETAEKSGLYYAMFIAPASLTGSYGRCGSGNV
jgi:exonuclease III